MPRRSTVDLLPKEERDWLDKSLIAGAFSGYADLAAALTARGFTISRSALQRYGSQFEDNLARMKLGAQQAAALAEALPDDAGQLGDAVTRMIQQKVFDLLMEMEVEPGDVKLTDLGTMMAKLNSSSVQQKKWIAETKAKAKATAEDVVKELRAAGLTDDLADEVRRKILGIAK